MAKQQRYPRHLRIVSPSLILAYVLPFGALLGSFYCSSIAMNIHAHTPDKADLPWQWGVSLRGADYLWHVYSVGITPTRLLVPLFDSAAVDYTGWMKHGFIRHYSTASYLRALRFNWLTFAFWLTVIYGFAFISPNWLVSCPPQKLDPEENEGVKPGNE